MTYLYALIDPRTVEIRYIGKTTNPKARYKGHLYDQSKTHRGAWLRVLRRLGLKPVMNILEPIGSSKEAAVREQELIRDYRDEEYNLVTATAGGEGMPGFHHTAKTKQKMREAALGRERSTETRRKIGAASRGRECSVKTRQKLSEAMSGRQRTAEHCANIRKAKLGKKRGPPSKEWRAKISAALTGRTRKPLTTEHRRKISEARRHQPTSRKAIDAMAAANRGRKCSPATREKLQKAALRREACKRQERMRVAS